MDNDIFEVLGTAGTRRRKKKRRMNSWKNYSRIKDLRGQKILCQRRKGDRVEGKIEALKLEGGGKFIETFWKSQTTVESKRLNHQ
jgi:hypothetical protein